MFLPQYQVINEVIFPKKVLTNATPLGLHVLGGAKIHKILRIIKEPGIKPGLA